MQFFSTEFNYEADLFAQRLIFQEKPKQRRQFQYVKAKKANKRSFFSPKKLK